MGSIIWVLKNKALDAWEDRLAWFRIWARRGLWAFALAALGLASYAAWDMTEFPQSSTSSKAQMWMSHAPVANCEKELAGVPRAYRIESWWPQWVKKETVLGCRKEGGQEFVERRQWAGWDGVSDPSLAKLGQRDPRVMGMGHLDGLAWGEARARASWRGFAESLGVADLTEASRGLSASTEAAAMKGILDWLIRAAVGLMLLGGLLWWLMAAGAGVLIAGITGAVAALVMNMASKTWGTRAAVAMGVGVAALGMLAGPAVSALGAVMGLERPGELSASGEMIVARAAPLPDCEARLGTAVQVGKGRSLACGEEGGAMIVVVWTPKSWSEARASASAASALGLKELRLSEGRAPGELSWRALKELSGWAEPTAASRAWAASRAPRWVEAGSWGGAQWRQLSDRSMIGFGLMVLGVALAWGGMRAGVLAWSFARMAKAKAGELARAGETDPEFRARAERRELEKEARKDGAGGRAPKRSHRI